MRGRFAVFADVLSTGLRAKNNAPPNLKFLPFPSDLFVAELFPVNKRDFGNVLNAKLTARAPHSTSSS